MDEGFEEACYFFEDEPYSISDALNIEKNGIGNGERNVISREECHLGAGPPPKNCTSIGLKCIFKIKRNIYMVKFLA